MDQIYIMLASDDSLVIPIKSLPENNLVFPHTTQLQTIGAIVLQMLVSKPLK